MKKINVIIFNLNKLRCAKSTPAQQSLPTLSDKHKMNTKEKNE
jgi:hypothetical protein